MCVCVYVQSFQQDLQHCHNLDLGQDLVLFASVSTTTDARAECSFFCLLHHLHVPLFTPELLVPAGVCGFVSRGTAAGD